MKFISARQAIHDAYATNLIRKGLEINPVCFGAAGKTKKQNNDSRICHTVEAGIVIAAVEGLDEPFRSWAKWAYGPRTQEFLPEQAFLFQWLEQDINEHFSSIDREYREVTKQKIRDVVTYCVLDYRSYTISGKHLYPVSLIINRCGIIRQNWKRDFESWHRYYWGLCDEFLDRGCLSVVGAVAGKLKGAD